MEELLHAERVDVAVLKTQDFFVGYRSRQESGHCVERAGVAALVMVLRW